MKRFYSNQEMTLKDIADIVGKTDKTVLKKYKENKAFLNNKYIGHKVREGKKRKLYFNMKSADALIDIILGGEIFQKVPKRIIKQNGNITLYEYKTIEDDELENLKKEFKVILKNNPKAFERLEKKLNEIKEEMDKKDKLIEGLYFDEMVDKMLEEQEEKGYTAYLEFENERLKKDIKYFKREYRKVRKENNLFTEDLLNKLDKL
jgi:hypothetical protein